MYMFTKSPSLEYVSGIKLPFYNTPKDYFFCVSVTVVAKHKGEVIFHVL